MKNEQLLEKLAKLGFDELHVLRTDQHISNPREDGVGYGLSGAMGRLPATALVLNLIPELLVEFEAQLARGHFTDTISGDAWYLDGHAGKKPRCAGFLDAKVSYPQDDRLRFEQGAVDPSADVVLVDDGMHMVAIEVHEHRVSLLERVRAEPRTDETVTSTSVSQLTPELFVRQQDDPWLFQLLGEQLAVESMITQVWAMRAFLRYRLPKKSDARYLEQFTQPESMIRARAVLKQTVSDNGDLIERVSRAEAETLADDLLDACNRAASGEEIDCAEWLYVCERREWVEVLTQTLPVSDDRDDLRSFLDIVDERGELLIVESDVAKFKMDSEQLRRGVLAGDKGWWLRSHAIG